jgi:hypothetical protein
MAEGGSVGGARHDPQFLGTDRCFIDRFRVTAGNAVIRGSANQQNGKGAGGDRFFG